MNICKVPTWRLIKTNLRKVYDCNVKPIQRLFQVWLTTFGNYCITITSLKGLIYQGVVGVYRRKVVPTKTPPLRSTRVISATWKYMWNKTVNGLVTKVSFHLYKWFNWAKLRDLRDHKVQMQKKALPENMGYICTHLLTPNRKITDSKYFHQKIYQYLWCT